MEPEAVNILYWGFRRDPTLRAMFRGSSGIYSFFKTLLECSVSGAFSVLCLRDRGRVVAVAVVSKGGVSCLWIRLLPVAFKLAIAVSLRGVAKALAFSPYLRRYTSALRGICCTCHLHFIASIAPGRGYGSRLLKLVEEWCCKHACNCVTLEVDAENRALIFYVKRGFRPLQSVPFLGRLYVVMVKPLNCRGLAATR